ncbi:hypothetical protein DL95DRAFT_397678, partial [Leptodontidium sp. 2 PMI_412]
MSLTMTFQYMKGDRLDLSKFVTLTLWEDRELPHLCPIIHFLALAFEHDAFEFTLEQIFRPRIDPKVIEVPFRAEVLETPLFRDLKGEPWSYNACSVMFKAVVYRVGYEAPASAYSIRRWAVNALD